MNPEETKPELTEEERNKLLAAEALLLAERQIVCDKIAFLEKQLEDAGGISPLKQNVPRPKKKPRQSNRRQCSHKGFRT